jgi:hypothetical protein
VVQCDRTLPAAGLRVGPRLGKTRGLAHPWNAVYLAQLLQACRSGSRSGARAAVRRSDHEGGGAMFGARVTLDKIDG